MNIQRHYHSLAAVAVMCSVLATPAGGALPHRTPVHCGDVVTTDVRLTRDLQCSGPGLILGAPGITVDLRGHTITGSGTAVGVQANPDRPADGATVRNGTIAGYDIGFAIAGGSHLSLVDIRVTGSVSLSSFPDGALTDTTIQGGSARSIVIAGADRTRITGVTVDEIRMASDADGTRVQFSTVTGLVYLNEADDGVIDHNRFANAAVQVQNTFGYTIQDNAFSGPASGIQVSSSAANLQIRHNTFTGSRIGIQLSTIFLDESRGTAISRNTFIGNGEAGIYLNAVFGTADPPLTISGNRVIGSGFGAAAGAAVNDGIHLALPPDPSLTVSGNKVRDNFGYGIEAPNGVSDGDWPNHASGNHGGVPPQCLGVTCVP